MESSDRPQRGARAVKDVDSDGATACTEAGKELVDGDTATFALARSCSAANATGERKRKAFLWGKFLEEVGR